jgi:hypothetical protein
MDFGDATEKKEFLSAGLSKNDANKHSGSFSLFSIFQMARRQNANKNIL